MGLPKEYHRTLVSGIKIMSGRKGAPQLPQIPTGTLTGLATRNSDGKKMLVTNLHVMAGESVSGVMRDALGNEEMYQGALAADKKVGSIADWVPITPGLGANNIADVAMCELDKNVEAEFTLHDHPSHSKRHIIAGVVDPFRDDNDPMELTILGAVSGEGIGRVEKVNQTVRVGGMNFTGLIVLDTGNHLILSGDSGAACLSKVKDEEYRMSCILFASEGTKAWTFPASVAEKKLSITFGIPVVSLNGKIATGLGSYRFITNLDGNLPGWLFADNVERSAGLFDYLPASVLGGKRFRLRTQSQTRGLFRNLRKGEIKLLLKYEDGTIESVDLDGVEHFESNGRDLEQLNFKLSAEADITAYRRVDEIVEIELRFHEQLNSPPMANAGPDQTVAPKAIVTLHGTGSNDPDGGTLTYSWKQTGGLAVALSSSGTAMPTFTVPSGATTLMFRLTVSDGHGGSDTDTVSITVRQPKPLTPNPHPTSWSDTGRTRDCGKSREKEQARTSSSGSSETQWVSAPEAERWGSWTNSGDHRGCGPSREAKQERTSHCGTAETRWVSSPETETWGNWANTGAYKGCGPNRQAKQQRTSSCGNTETQWVSSPETETWGDWANTGAYKGCGPNRQAKQQRTSSCGNTETQWVSSPETETWGNWANTAAYKGCGPNRQAKQQRTSSCGNTETRWVSSPETETWGNWANTGAYKGCGPNRQAKQQRTSHCGTAETRWVSSPETETWGNWANTGAYQGCGPNRQAKQQRTSSCGNTETQWVSSPETETWGSWTDTGERRISPDHELIRQRKETRSSSCGNTETRWVYHEPVDQSPVWGSWKDTGKKRGSLAARKKEQVRTSEGGDRQTRWVRDPEPIKWGSWTDTGEYRENPDTFITEYEQKRTSNYGNVEYRWIE